MRQGKEAVTISCRVSSAQNRLLEAFARQFAQKKSDLIRESIQLWINSQVEQRGMPKMEQGIEVP